MKFGIYLAIIYGIWYISSNTIWNLVYIYIYIAIIYEIWYISRNNIWNLVYI